MPSAPLRSSTPPRWHRSGAASSDRTTPRRRTPGCPARIARACRERGLRLIALSTDLVFSGERAPLGEQEPARPLSVYGRTKLAGEDAVLAEHPAAAIARIALVVGRGHGARPSASESVVWTLRTGGQPLLFERRVPHARRSRVPRAGRQRGSWSAVAPAATTWAGRERLSRYELGRRVALALGLDASALRVGRQADLTASEPRAADVSLDSARARRELGWEPRALDESLRESRLGPPD